MFKESRRSKNLGPVVKQTLADIIRTGEEVAMPEEKLIDLNNPPKMPYRFQEFPKLLYSATGQIRSVSSIDEQETALGEGFGFKPSSDHDYSAIRHGRAAPKVGIANVGMTGQWSNAVVVIDPPLMADPEEVATLKAEAALKNRKRRTE